MKDQMCRAIVVKYHPGTRRLSAKMAGEKQVFYPAISSGGYEQMFVNAAHRYAERLNLLIETDDPYHLRTRLIGGQIIPDMYTFVLFYE